MNENINNDELLDLSNNDILQILISSNFNTRNDFLLSILNSRKFKDIIKENLKYFKPRQGDIDISYLV